MKHTIFFIAFISCLATQANATEQRPDIIIHDGVIYNLHGGPNKDFPLELFWNDPNTRPNLCENPGGINSTACYRGYVAIWEVEKGVLYLKGLDSWQGDKKVNLKLLFPKRFKDRKVKADWFTGTLKLNTGDRTNPMNTIDIQFNKGEQSTSKADFSTLSDNNLPGSKASLDTIAQISSTIISATAKEDAVITDRGSAHISTSMDMGGGRSISGGGYVTHVRCDQRFEVDNILYGKSTTGEHLFHYGIIEKSDASPGPRAQVLIPSGMKVILFIDNEAQILKTLIFNPENLQTVGDVISGLDKKSGKSNLTN